MPTLEPQIKNIQFKIQQLVKLFAALKKENARLNIEKEALQKKVTDYQESIEQLQQQVEVLKISGGNWNDKDKKDFEKRIAGYIKEVDKCINLLSR
ncbi:MAG: hypothetical protein H0V30_03890 [Chitinophagaceae bacterium]|jgi:chromosome segregation ATPase|nr:hypothetical protein [Chitinophagaceae bacterium]